MTSIVRPDSSQRTRRLVVLGLAVFAVLAGQIQALAGWGQTPAEFSADGDETLRIAGYAFAIWGLIYLGLLAYAVYQVLPATGESDVLRRLGWPSAATFAGIGLWVIAAAFDQETVTIVLIVGSTLALIIPMMGMAPDIRATPVRDRDRWLVLWPLGLLAGWLTIASAANILTVMTDDGALPDLLPRTAWALAAVGVVVAVALTVTWRLRLLAFPIPIAWGLIAVFVAEQADNPTLGFPALAAALAVVVGAVILAFRLRLDVARD